jgi:uncharacterized protein (DUF4415 family)
MAEDPKFTPGRSYNKKDWDEVSDNPEWTADDFGRAKPFAEVFPEMAATLRRGRGKQVAPTKELVSLRLSREVLAKFRALGPGWQTRIDEVLSEAAKGL